MAVSIRDVARAAGVSITQASFALNGRSGVAEQTRRRVREAAERLGYRANPHARALRGGPPTTFGLVLRTLADPFFLDVIGGAQEVAGQAGATVLVLDSEHSAERELRHVERLADHRVGGLAVAPVGAGESVRRWRELCPDLPAVVVNARAEGVPRVGPDDLAAVELPVRRLAELGHREIALLTPPAPAADPDRLRHFRAVTAELGLAGRVVVAPPTPADVHAAVLRALRGRHPPTAVITDSDHTALAVYRAARDLGLVVGRELSVVGHDDLPTSEMLDPPLATVRVDRRAIGRALMARLLTPRTLGDHREFVRLVERVSLGPVGLTSTRAVTNPPLV